MKKLVVALLFIVGITAMAQEKEMKRPNGDKFASLTPEQKVEFQVKKMSKDLNLNEKQVKEMKALVTKEVEKREAIKAEMTIAQISSKYGVHSTQIQVWKKRGIENLVSGFQVKPATKDPDNQDLIKQLYEQIGQLSVERDWLKKKSTLFGLGN